MISEFTRLVAYSLSYFACLEQINTLLSHWIAHISNQQQQQNQKYKYGYNRMKKWFY